MKIPVKDLVAEHTFDCGQCFRWEKISENEALAYINNLLDHDIITSREAIMISSALSNAALNNVLPRSAREVVRAGIFKHIILSIMQ